jgi:hypothetical protein
MPDEEEMRLRAAITDCRRLSLDASHALMHAVYSAANDNAAYLKLVESNAIASEQYTAARVALRAYRRAKNLSDHAAD